jgi:solute carrier family 34 (sodium-dependent phosphate cotransporter)
MNMDSGVHETGTRRVYFQVLMLLGYLYLFLLSIDMMGSSMKMFGKGFTENLIASTSNPVVGLFIGILATSLIQSSSTTTSIVVGLVGGGALTVSTAIPIVMGANIGTSVTNTLVALANMNRSTEFKRSFAASIVHDFFNFCSVLILFPLQYYTNFLGHSSGFLADAFQNVGGLSYLNPVKAITKPVVHLISGLINDIAWLLLLIALAFLFIALKQVVTILRKLVLVRAEALFDKVIFKTAIRAFVVGMLLTISVQSSSVTTSLLIPFAGAGLLTLTQIYPFTLGSNVGTTITAVLASLVTGQIHAVQVAFAHVLFNFSGIAIWYPLKRVPITLAEKFAEMATRNKFYPLAYILVMFFIIPSVLIFVLR